MKSLRSWKLLRSQPCTAQYCSASAFFFENIGIIGLFFFFLFHALNLKAYLFHVLWLACLWMESSSERNIHYILYVLVIHCLKKVYATLGACILSTASRGRLLRKRSESIKAGEKTSLLFMSLVNTFLIRLWSQSSASSLTDYSMMFILCMMSHWYSNRWSVCVFIILCLFQNDDDVQKSLVKV